MQQEATHELVGRHGYGFIAGAPVFAVVLPTERDVAVVRGHEARVGDGHKYRTNPVSPTNEYNKLGGIDPLIASRRQWIGGLNPQIRMGCCGRV